MKKIGIRKYEVMAADFVLQIDLKAKDLPACLAVVGDLQIKKDDEVVAAQPVRVRDDPDHLAIHFSIKKPGRQSPLSLVLTIECTFPDNPPATAAYEATITSATGDVERTIGSVPSINPRVLILTFIYREELAS